MPASRLLRKLQHRDELPVVVLWSPGELEDILVEWAADGVEVHRRPRDGAPFVVAFVRSKGEVEQHAARLVAQLARREPVLWLAHPKPTSTRYRCDIDGPAAWQPLADLGWHRVREVAVDGEWTALRFRRPQTTGAASVTEAVPRGWREDAPRTSS